MSLADKQGLEELLSVLYWCTAVAARFARHARTEQIARRLVGLMASLYRHADRFDVRGDAWYMQSRHLIAFRRCAAFQLFEPGDVIKDSDFQAFYAGKTFDTLQAALASDPEFQAWLAKGIFPVQEVIAKHRLIVPKGMPTHDLAIQGPVLSVGTGAMLWLGEASRDALPLLVRLNAGEVALSKAELKQQVMAWLRIPPRVPPGWTPDAEID